MYICTNFKTEYLLWKNILPAFASLLFFAATAVFRCSVLTSLSDLMGTGECKLGNFSCFLQKFVQVGKKIVNAFDLYVFP